MKNKIKKLLFGERVQGHPVSSPLIKTTKIPNRPSENEWFNEVKFGSRYGHRGSFYNN